MAAIKKKVKIIVLENLDLTDRTVEYFRKSGFKQLESKEQKLKFGRGSIASNMWTFNPLKWKSEINVEILAQEVTMDFNINVTGQIHTHKEEKLWNSFIENYEHFLTNKDFDFKTENEKRLKTTKKNRMQYVGWALLGGLMGGIPAGFIAHWTGIDIIASIGATGGAIGLLIRKINKDKKKNVL